MTFICHASALFLRVIVNHGYNFNKKGFFKSLLPRVHRACIRRFLRHSRLHTWFQVQVEAHLGQESSYENNDALLMYKYKVIHSVCTSPQVRDLIYG